MSNPSRSHQLSDSENDNTIKIPADKLIEALFHAKQCEQHYATQESVDNLKESVSHRFDAVDKKFDAVDKRFEKIENKLDRFHWFIVAAVLSLFFKEQIMAFFS
jgi:hypothetical protein